MVREGFDTRVSTCKIHRPTSNHNNILCRYSIAPEIPDCFFFKGKENSPGHKSASSRHSRSLRMERGSHHNTEVTPPRSQSVGAAGASRIKPGAGHQSPADLERKHSQLVRRPSGMFGGKPAFKTPRVDQTTGLFGKLQSALR